MLEYKYSFWKVEKNAVVYYQFCKDSLRYIYQHAEKIFVSCQLSFSTKLEEVYAHRESDSLTPSQHGSSVLRTVSLVTILF